MKRIIIRVDYLFAIRPTHFRSVNILFVMWCMPVKGHLI